MSGLIPADPGWRVCIHSREQGGAVGLIVVAWERRSETREDRPAREWLEPWVLTEFGEQVSPLAKGDWFVGLMPPGSELADYTEAAEQVAKAEEEAEDRQYEQRQREAANSHPRGDE